MKIKTLEHITKLNQLFKSARYPLSASQIEDALGCQLRTRQRIISYLRDGLGAPIERNDVGYYYDESEKQSYELPGIWLSEEEIYALLLVNALLRNVADGLFAEELHELSTHARNLLNLHQKHKHLVSEIIQFQAHHRRQSAGEAVLPRLIEAALDEVPVCFEYTSRHKNETLKRSVSVSKIMLYLDNWYMLGFCHIRNAPRTFSLDLIRAVDLCADVAFVALTPEQQNELQQSYGLFDGQVNKVAVLRFSNKVSRWVSAEKWHPKQQGKWLKGGAYELTVPYAQSIELKREVLKYGAEVKVCSPDKLREEIQQEIQKMSDKYQCGTDSDA